MKQAMFWEPADSEGVRCSLCSHYCLIQEGSSGICGVRVNREGLLYSLSYGHLIARSPDPVEKKPLYHFYPGSISYSIGSPGCNFSCPFCQNYSIARGFNREEFFREEPALPQEVVDSAIAGGCSSISYTYTEPTISLEFAYDTARIARKKSLKNILVTNGYMSGTALEKILPYIDAANVDLKGSEDFYVKLCKAKRAPVIENIERLSRSPVWTEVTTLLIPEYNDSASDLLEIAGIIRDIDPGIPWHISRFFPVYKMSDHYPADIDSIKRAREAGLESGLKYVYAGNIVDENSSSTYCNSCGRLLILRSGYRADMCGMEENRCSFCGTEVQGFFV